MYDRMKNMPDSPERNRLFLLMSRQMEVDGAWKLGVSRYRNVLVYPQVRGYRYHPINTAVWEYLDIDPAARKQLASPRLRLSAPLDFRRCGARFSWSLCRSRWEKLPERT